MRWPPNKAWTSSTSREGYRHFEVKDYGGKGEERWVVLSAVLDKNIELDVKDGAVGVYYDGEKGYCNWAWFEDNILQDFFNLSTKDGVELQKVESKLNEEPNICQNTTYLYSLGLDSVILPNQHQQVLSLL